MELLTHASLILPMVTQTINNISVYNFINLRNLQPPPHTTMTGCCVLSSSKGFEWRQVSKNSKTIWGISYCCQTNPPFLSQQLNILTIMLQQKWQVHINLHTISDIHYRSHISKWKEIICINIQQNEYKMLCNIYF